MRCEKVFFIVVALSCMSLVHVHADTLDQTDMATTSTTIEPNTDSAMAKSKATIGFTRESSSEEGNSSEEQNSSEQTNESQGNSETSTTRENGIYIPSSSTSKSQYSGLLPSTGEATQLLLLIIGVLVICIIWLMIVYRNREKKKRGESK
ncbi:LPXTG cell wall anchor domain-containing protein [uncultured Enterococcus sp.]|uniref:LPXTG cell wall anchor domain-containing protein n=1 Tax=uncultured Enterococcus sp. TaxID=167972 RepID=UPI0025E7DAC5|nr:LPXTG cell wall anchor domain-containing protein [uncultured Enterococcus sp.]